MAMDSFTLDDLAHLSETEAVRRRFDARNVAVVRWYLRAGLMLSFVEIIMAMAEGFSRIPLSIAVANLLLVLLLIPLFRTLDTGRLSRFFFLRRLASALGRYPRGTVLAYVIVQLVLAVAYPGLSEASFVWFIIVAYLMVPLRVQPSEFFLLYGVLIVVSFVVSMLQLFGGASFDPGVTISTGVNAVVAISVALGLTRRFRRQFLEQWRVQQNAAREQIRMREELEYAREIQLSMLPVESPAIDWLEISTISLPATEVGGDYFDYFQTDDGRLAVVTCDVAGHGLASGLVLSGVRSCLALLSEELVEPSSVMRRMHRMVKKTDRHRMLVTMSILLLDPDRGHAIVSSAGHPPILVRRAAGEVEELHIESLPLGAALASTFEEHPLNFATGDLFVLHTDGIYEALNPAGEQYGMDRLRDVVASGEAEAGAQEVRDAIIRDLWEFRDSAPQEDDITLVVLKVRDPFPSR